MHARKKGTHGSTIRTIGELIVTSPPPAVTFAMTSVSDLDIPNPALFTQFALLTMAAGCDVAPLLWNQTAIEKLSTLFSANHVRRNDTWKCAHEATMLYSGNG